MVEIQFSDTKYHVLRLVSYKISIPPPTPKITPSFQNLERHLSCQIPLPIWSRKLMGEEIFKKMGTSVSPSLDPKQKPVMGYPSMVPPVYPVPLQPISYPSSFHYAPDPHIDPFNNAYYYQNPYLPPIPNPKKKTSFGRVMLILMVVLVAIMCTMSLVMWFLFGTYIPGFQVMSLNLSNFTATDTSFTGKWDADVTVSNLNGDLEIHFSNVRSSVFYRDSMMGISSMQPFELKKGQALHLNVSVPAEQVTGADSSVLRRLAEDQRNGIVVFSLRLAFQVNFTSANIVYKHEVLRVFCENLRVNISAGGKGTLAQDFGSECLIRIAND